jgi:hypothetical protein
MDQHFASLAKPIDMAIYLQRCAPIDDVTCPTSTTKCVLRPKVLGTCRRFYQQGLKILYVENRFIAVHSDVAKYDELLRKFGIGCVWGPFRPLNGKVISAVSEHLLDDATRNEHMARIEAVMTCAVGHEMDRSVDPHFLWGEIFICPLNDRDRVLKTFGRAFRAYADAMSEAADRDQDDDTRWLRLYFRSDLYVPGLCHDGNALAKFVLEDVVPKTRSFIESISFGRPGVENPLDQHRQLRINEALSTAAHLDRFSVAYEDAEKWLGRKERGALKAYSAGDMAKAEELFMEVDEFARSFLRFGYSFDNLTALFPIEHNRVMLYSSVALYHLCKIRANPENSRTYAGNPRACLMFAAEHGIIALDLPSPVPEPEWSARISLMLCPILAALGDSYDFYHYFSRAFADIEAIVEDRNKADDPLNEELTKVVINLRLWLENTYLREKGLVHGVQLAKAFEVNFVAKAWGAELSSTQKEDIWRPVEF